MTDTITISADPGRQGAIAILHGKKLLDVFDIPFIDIGGYQCVDQSSMWVRVNRKTMQFCDPLRAVIESPTPRRDNGVTNTFKSGMWFSSILEAMRRIAYSEVHENLTVVTAQKWKKAMGCTADKQTSMREACARFPDHKHLFYGPRGGALDGRAEAALIGLYGAMYV